VCDGDGTDSCTYWIYVANLIILFGYGLSSGPISCLIATDILPDIGVAISIFF